MAKKLTRTGCLLFWEESVNVPPPATASVKSGASGSGVAALAASDPGTVVDAVSCDAWSSFAIESPLALAFVPGSVVDVAASSLPSDRHPIIINDPASSADPQTLIHGR